MESNKKVELEKLLDSLIAARSCYKDIKVAAEKVKNGYNDQDIKVLTDELKDGVTPIDKSIAFIESDMGKQIFGNARDAVLADAKKKQSEGETICTCDACQIGAKILRLLGEKI